MQIDHLLDRETVKVSITDKGVTKIYYIDNRLGTSTPGKVYDDYPDKGKLVGPNTQDRITKLYNANK